MFKLLVAMDRGEAGYPVSVLVLVRELPLAGFCLFNNITRYTDICYTPCY